MTAADWWARAACAEHPDPELWFPEKGEANKSKGHRINEALAVCCRCWVARDCLVEALRDERGKDRREWHGIRGGLTVRERARLIREHQQRQAA